MGTASAAFSASSPGDEIPIIDISGVRAGDTEALARCARALQHAYEDVGFWFLEGHGIPQPLIDRVYAEVERFHAQPPAEKIKLKINEHNIGYLAIGAATTRHSDVSTNNRPNLNEAFFVKRDLPLDHPDVIANKRFRGANQWPANLPGFRETIVEYCTAMERLSLSILPIYAVALDLPPDYFSEAFREPQYQLRMSHYPDTPQLQQNEYGLAPHADTSFMTLLAPNKVPGLSLRTASNRWIDAPAIDGAFLVNSGQMLNRWSNDRFRATPHRVINRSGGDRYAIPFFFDCTIDYEMVCLPTCTGPGNPPKYEPTTYMKFVTAYQRANYDHVRNAGSTETGTEKAG
ncbi:Isopenicillin N synthase [Enhydrobacter aerosaccus]|uniref:2-oxoglutarate-dependent ethylene/succinate-forming enzyme n=1 Tax=Enhydrobacter aerosaccus TaxID=225324 RepID=A0A1T4T643_9HYPH|nr:2-oxoglutarate and iron-dependent oxygenase domain-containing protein [Enhydrobacter aerosaccus]SKA35779.1 Isopenicillin N synthase [Enhydrobacter aerosaccus]